MKVSVLGGGGFIGSHIAGWHASHGDAVTCFDLRFSDLRADIRGDALLVTGDLRKQRLVEDAVRDADFVYLLAADMGGVGYFHSDSDVAAATNNALIDMTVIKECRRFEKPFFYASSACALPTEGQFGGGDYVLREELLGAGRADQLYGEEKRFGAMLCADDPLARVGIIHTVYGPGQEWSGRRTKFPPAICGKVKLGGEIEIWGDGSQVRTMLYIDDAVQKILTVAHDERYGGPVNIGSDEQVTVLECAEWLCEHAGVEPRFRFDLSKPTGVLERSCDNTLFDETFGRPEVLPARDGLVRLYEWLPF